MNALLCKDRPWSLFLLVAGAAGLAGAVMEHSFLWAFIVSPGRFEALFHVAWPLGLVTGAAAACFDEALGTREFLHQRSVARGSVLRARVVGCALVLGGWFVLVPIATTIAYWFGDPNFQFGVWRQLPLQWVTMTAAVSAAGIGFAAGSLPCPWWLRILAASVALLATFSTIFWAASDADMRLKPSVFAWLHTGAGAGFFAMGLAAARFDRDADQPLAPPLRRVVVAPWLACATLLFCIVQTEVVATAFVHLRAAYPEPMIVDGRVVLAVQTDWREPRLLVDSEHRPSGVAVERGKGQPLAHESPGVGNGFVRLEMPRADRARTAGWRITVDVDGTAFIGSRDGYEVVGKTAAHLPFAPGSVADKLVDGKTDWYLIGDVGGRDVWRFDDALGHFVPVALPDGDRFVRFGWMNPAVLEVAPPNTMDRQVVCGERGVYGLHAGAWQRVATSLDTPPPDGLLARMSSDDVLSWTLEFDGHEGVAPFRHEFTPRTFTEWRHAGFALWLAALRPPVLQGAAHALPRTEYRWHCLLDPLVAGGRRLWLVVAGLVLALLLAWRTGSRLRRLGADAGTVRFWTFATVLLGPLGAGASILCERPRAYARITIPSPAPRPRIESLSSTTEVVA